MALLLAVVQTSRLWASVPGPDTIAYFESADQIAKVGYGRGLSLHWAPLYPLYLRAVDTLVNRGLEAELAVSLVGYAVLVLVTSAITALMVRALGRHIWSGEDADDRATRGAFTAYGLGWILYLCFSVLRVNLRLPDVLVLCFGTLVLTAWAVSIRDGLALRWAFSAGALSGLGFLARGNILHWSVGAAIVACALAPAVTRRRRGSALVAFLVGLVLFVVPHTWLLTSGRGEFVFGESGKLAFAEIYGAVWETGTQRWPTIDAVGVRTFPEERDLNFPNFYEPGREYEGATIPFSLLSAARGVGRGVQSCLFGYYTTSFALMWPLIWGAWPWTVVGLTVSGDGPSKAQIARTTLWRRIAWFLVFAGGGGVTMHLLSFCIGYYLPPYILAITLGLTVLMLLNRGDRVAAAYARRACYIVAAGFVLVTTLSTLAMFRAAHAKSLDAGIARTRAVAKALSDVPAPNGKLRRIAVVGHAIGEYAIRLSRSQVFADIPDAKTLDDLERLGRVVTTLRAHDVRAILAPATATACDASTPLSWEKVGDSGWCLARLDRMTTLTN